MKNCSLLHLNPCTNLVARGCVGIILELIPSMCKHCIVGKNHFSPLKGLMEAASIIEMIIQYIHSNLEEGGHLPKSLLVTCFDPMAHVTETEDEGEREREKNMWPISTNKYLGWSINDKCTKQQEMKRDTDLTQLSYRMRSPSTT